MKKLVFIRKLSQIFFLILFIYLLWPKSHLSDNFPGTNIFKLDPLLLISTSISSRVFIEGIGLSLLLLLLTLILGRFFCGWVCPLGTIIDFFGKLKIKSNLKISSILKNLKYVILFFIFIFALFGVQIAWILDPIVTAGRFVSFYLIGAATYFLNSLFIFLIQKLNLYGPVYDLYRNIKGSFLGTNVHSFDNSLAVFIFFIFICCASIFILRFWCRFICPLGALFALVSKKSFLEKNVSKCSFCSKCSRNCRMSAINQDLTYDKSECILCMDCIYECPSQSIKWGQLHLISKDLSSKIELPQSSHNYISRKNFLFLLFSSFSFLGFAKIKNNKNFKVIRPPGVVNEEDFKRLCIRCGNCMNICMTKGLQPTLFKTGIDGLWTPELIPEIGYCEYSCNLCSQVCPTQAIPKLSNEQKQKTKLGVAKIDRSICLAWNDKMECIVCEEHCPVPSKAIKTQKENINGNIIYLPIVDERLCVGCGICQNKCPARPERAIKVIPL